METHASGFYPTSSDPNELRRAVTEQARAQERNVLTFQNHMTLITRVESNLIALADSNTKTTIELTKLKTKMALVSGLGALIGGGIVAIVTQLIGG